MADGPIRMCRRCGLELNVYFETRVLASDKTKGYSPGACGNGP